MKFNGRWSMWVMLVAVILWAGPIANARQEDAQASPKQDEIHAKLAQAKQAHAKQAQALAKHAQAEGKNRADAAKQKIEALVKAMENLAAKRAAVAHEQGKDSEAVGKLSERMAKIKEQVGQIRHAAKDSAVAHDKHLAQAEKEHVQAKLAKAAEAAHAGQKKQHANISAQVQEMMRQHGFKPGQLGGNVRVHKGPAGETVIVIRKEGRPGETKHKAGQQSSSGEEKAIVPGGKGRVQERRPNPPMPGAGRHSDMDQEEPLMVPRPNAREMDRSPEVRRNPQMEQDRFRADQSRPRSAAPGGPEGPGPIEAVRRVRALEERMDQIERKLDAILERLDQRGPRPTDLRSPDGRIDRRGPDNGRDRPDQPRADARPRELPPLGGDNAPRARRVEPNPPRPAGDRGRPERPDRPNEVPPPLAPRTPDQPQ